MEKTRVLWTRTELDALIPTINNELTQIENKYEEVFVKPIPPMNKEECIEKLISLVEGAKITPITDQQAFIHGQLLAQFEMSVRAETLGHPRGRYLVIDSEMINEMLGKMTQSN